MSESFLICFRPASSDFDFTPVDHLLQQKFSNETPRMLEPGAWVLKSDEIRWSRNIIERLSSELRQLSGGAIMVRSIRDPRDFAVYPHKANEYTEFCNLQALVKKHRLHPD
jgi:hypothetical protein